MNTAHAMNLSHDSDHDSRPGLPVIGLRTRPVIARLRAYAGLPETLLITGPTGAGKSRLARWVHAQSPRRDAPFVTVDLLSTPGEMQLAELFGWRRGSFTGALRDQQGAIGRAGSGTLFIDEIDKLSLDCQAGLLRLLEERRYRCLGDERDDRICDARIVVGTNIDLGAAVARGAFREDLFYRLNVLVAALPGLADRCDEIPEWAAFMVARRHMEAGGQGPARISEDASRLLSEASWPGNLRQLDNVLRRAWAMCLSESPDGQEIGARHVRLALDHSQRSLEGECPVIGALERAADALIDEQCTRGAEGQLDLAALDVWRGIVLERAVARLGHEVALASFGAESMVEHRNFRRVLKRARERVDAFRVWLANRRR